MLQIRPMTPADIAVGMRLKTEAKWNQVEADWRRFLALEPEGCFLAEYAGEPVGTLTTCVFGAVAWIAMVLVDARMRGKGIGARLMSHALEYLDARGIPSIRLDATALGQPLYEKLGFTEEYRVMRYEGALSPVDAPDPVVPYHGDHFAAVVELDRAVTGTDRAKMLAALLAEQPEEARVVLENDAVTGFLVSRPGERAWQLGPCSAVAPRAGSALLADACRRHAGQQVFADIPAENTPAIALAEAAGLTVQRPFLRMCRGPRLADSIARIWISSGPEKG